MSQIFRIEPLAGRITLRILMRRFAWFQLAATASALALLASCAEVPVTPTTAAAPTPVPGYWQGDGVSGDAKIVVSLSEQRAYFFKGKRLVGETTVSTGKPGFSTPPGHYSVVWKDQDHVSTVFGDYVDDSGNVVKSNIDVRKDSRPSGSHYDGARMPYAMFFRGGYAMHQGYVPPFAASHGCIRLPAAMAAVFFQNAPYGTPVIVKQEAVGQSVVPPLNPVPTLAPPSTPLVRSNSPASIRPASTSVSVQPSPPVVYRPPAPVRSPAPVISRAPSPAPVSYRAPVPVQSPTPMMYRAPVPVRSPAPVVSHPPVPTRSPAPVVSRASVPLHSPTPAPIRSSSPAPIHSTAPAKVHPTPAPVHSRKRRHHSQTHVHSPTPSPTPAVAPAN